MSEEKLKEVNIYSFNDENYVSLQDYAKLQQRIDKAIKKLESIKYILDDSNFNVTAKLDVKDKDIKETISILKGEDKKC